MKLANKLLTNNFNFGTTMAARIHFRNSINNIFLTLTDLDDKVIYTISTGMCTEAKNKKQRVSLLIMEKMTMRIIRKLYKLQITNLQLIIRSKLRRYFKTMLTLLLQYGIIITEMCDIRYLPHNGVRGKKPRRK